MTRSKDVIKRDCVKDGIAADNAFDSMSTGDRSPCDCAGPGAKGNNIEDQYEAINEE